jgi:hypothetical protein
MAITGLALSLPVTQASMMAWKLVPRLDARMPSFIMVRRGYRIAANSIMCP